MLFWINFLFFQWLCLRIGVNIANGDVYLMGFVAPLSGWCDTPRPAYYPRPPRKLLRLY